MGAARPLGVTQHIMLWFVAPSLLLNLKVVLPVSPLSDTSAPTGTLRKAMPLRQLAVLLNVWSALDYFTNLKSEATSLLARVVLPKKADAPVAVRRPPKRLVADERDLRNPKSLRRARNPKNPRRARRPVRPDAPDAVRHARSTDADASLSKRPPRDVAHPRRADVRDASPPDVAVKLLRIDSLECYLCC